MQPCSKWKCIYRNNSIYKGLVPIQLQSNHRKTTHGCQNNPKVEPRGTWSHTTCTLLLGSPQSQHNSSGWWKVLESTSDVFRAAGQRHGDVRPGTHKSQKKKRAGTPWWFYSLLQSQNLWATSVLHAGHAECRRAKTVRQSCLKQYNPLVTFR